ncbi:MAG TPA: alpha/beta hydrolase-fold protein [Catenuloplanes sp.]
MSGWLPAVLLTAGLVSLAALVVRPARRWWLRTLPLVLLGCVIVLVLAKIVIEQVWRPFPDPLPTQVLAWTGLGILGLCLAGIRLRSAVWSRRVCFVVAALVLVVLASNEVNRFYGQYPTVGSVLGEPPANEVSAVRLTPTVVATVPPKAGGPLAATWRAPAGMPARGVVAQVTIPSPASGFKARPGWVYVPPAYLTSPRPVLPVLVLLTGQPGKPRDWLDAGRLTATMDGYAAAHAGLAPVVVVADSLGATMANPLCLDSRLGNVQTYLTVDVPAWIGKNLQVTPDRRKWTIGGLSSGGTCALQIAVNAPTAYHNFIDISGQEEPTLGSRARTVKAAFGGDTAAFMKVNPLSVMARERRTGTSGLIIIGRDDAQYLPQARRVFAACQATGMRVHFRELPGKHSWPVWAAGFRESLPWLGTLTGLTR